MITSLQSSFSDQDLAAMLVMPVYNEAGCIQSVIQGWNQELKTTVGSRYQILVVDDGSKDNTGNILKDLQKEIAELRVVSQKNGGHTKAVLCSYEEAIQSSAEYIFQVDSDNQFNPQDFSKLWARRHESEFVLGNRRKRQDPFFRLMIARILRESIAALFGFRLADANVPFRLMKRTMLKHLLATVPQGIISVNIHLLVAAAQAGYQPVFVDVEHRPRMTGTVSIQGLKLLKSSALTFLQLLELRKKPAMVESEV